MVEGSPRCHWPHTWRGRDRPRRLVVGPGRTGTGRKAGTDNRMGRAIRVDLADVAVAARVRPGDDRHWAHFLLWTGRGSGLGLDLARRGGGHHPLAVGVASLQVVYRQLRGLRRLYGTVGGVIVVLLWFYISGIAILAGAEINAEIEHASPYGKAPAQKNAHGKLLIGRRAARAFREHQRAIESVLMESAATRAQGSHPATRPERTTTSPVALRTLPSTEHTSTRQADLVRIAVNAIVAVGWMRLAWKSTRLFRRAAVGAVVIGAALALGARRARD